MYYLKKNNVKAASNVQLAFLSEGVQKKSSYAIHPKE